jgi:hypothetical protein
MSPSEGPVVVEGGLGGSRPGSAITPNRLGSCGQATAHAYAAETLSGATRDPPGTPSNELGSGGPARVLPSTIANAAERPDCGAARRWKRVAEVAARGHDSRNGDPARTMSVPRRVLRRSGGALPSGRGRGAVRR